MTTLLVAQELAPLMEPEQDEASALRFDALMYDIELAYLAGGRYTRARNDLMKKVSAVAGVANIPAVNAQAELLSQILHTDYLDRAGINEFEHIRKCLRDLIKYIPRTGVRYDTDFRDEVLSMEFHESSRNMMRICPRYGRMQRASRLWLTTPFPPAFANR